MTDKIANTIRALLAKANGTENEHEAQAFTEKALELLAQHNLDISKVQGAASQPEAKVVEKKFDVYHRTWERWIYQACAKMYFCDLYTHQFIYRTNKGTSKQRSYLVRGVTFVGKAHNIEVAESMAEYLIRTITRLTSQSGMGENFSKGAANRVYDRMRKIWEGQVTPTSSNPGNLPALYGMEKKLIDEFMSKLGLRNSNRKVKVTDVSAWTAGKRAGDAISLNTQVGGGQLRIGNG